VRGLSKGHGEGREAKRKGRRGGRDKTNLTDGECRQVLQCGCIESVDLKGFFVGLKGRGRVSGFLKSDTEIVERRLVLGV